MLVAAAPTSADLAGLLRRRLSGQPLEHVVGFAEFCGLRISVGPGVFVPRRRTEFLVHEAAKVISPRDVVVDLCCGSGAVGAALLSLACEFTLHAVDIDVRAVEWARRNVAGRGQVHQGDLYHPLPIALRGQVKVIVGNAPYVPSAAIELMPREARLYEPLAALDGGEDGLDVQRRVVAGARQWLAPDGYLLVETSERQAPSTAELFAHGRLSPRIQRSEDLDATVVIGRLAPSPGVTV